MNTSSFAGRFDFGIGMKSLRSPELELSGRKWEDGCSNNNEGFFFLHSRAFLVTVLLVMGEVAGLVLQQLRNRGPEIRPMETSKRGIDFGLGRGFSGSQAAKHFLGMAAARYSGGPGKRAVKRSH